MSKRFTGETQLVLQIVDSPRRDLEWRLYFSYLLAKEGITSIIGSPHDIEFYCNICSNALLLGRFGGNSGRSKFDRRLIRALKNNDIDMFFLHDEGAFYFESEFESSVRRVYPEEYLNEGFFKRLYFWGEAQAKYYTRSFESDKLTVLGSPRFDLYKSKYKFIDRAEVSKIKEKFGDFVLICSRFGGLSPVPGDVSLLSDRLLEIHKEGLGDLRISDSELMANMLKVWKNVAIDQALFVDAVYSLCLNNPQKSFLFRPHPGEDMMLYRNVFRTLPNVTVDKGGDLRPILRAATLMIHSESTSGIEAEISGTPSINFVNTLDNDNMSIVGTKLVGHRVTSSLEMAHTFEKLCAGQRKDTSSEVTSEVSKHVANFDLGFDSINKLLCDVVEFYKKKGNSSMDNYYKSYIWKKPIARYWARKSLLSLRNYLSGVRLVNEGKAITISSEYAFNLWSQFGGDKSQISISSGVIKIKP